MIPTILVIEDNTLNRHRLAINLGFALAILLLTWAGWYSYRESIESRNSARQVAHTYEVLGSLYLLLSSLQEAETGQRGYILSGKNEYLGPYYHTATRIAGQLGQLRSLTADHPAQRGRVKAVFGIVARRLGVLSEGIAKRRTYGLDSAIAVVLTGGGKALVDSARSTVSDMQAIERDLLRERSRKSEILARRAELTIMLASILGLLLLATSALLANWEIRARRAQFRKLQELQAARDTLTHMIVHDLRGPLTGLQGYLDLLRIGLAAGSHEEVLQCARDAHDVAGRLKEMIGQVLDVSRLESGEMPLSPENTDLVGLLRRAVATLGPAPDGIAIIYETAVQPVVVACDGDVMTRVVANLVGNAFKFAPRRGEVRIGLERTNGVVRVTVADNGPGVDPEHRKVIFEKFGQAPLGRAGKARSTGLGLTFCKLAVEAHGGTIGVDGSAGGGARFWIELPRKAESS